MEINLEKVFHSWELEVFLLPPCKACTRSFNTSGNTTTPLVCRWTLIAQNQQASQYLAIWLSCLYAVFESFNNLYCVFQVIAGLIAGGSFAEMSDFMPGVKMLLQVAQQQVTHKTHLHMKYVWVQQQAESFLLIILQSGSIRGVPAVGILWLSWC